MSDIIKSHNIDHIVYADDTQVYLIFRPEDRASAIHRIERCIKDIKAWAVANKLQFNDAKTEVIHLTSRFKDTRELAPVAVGDSNVVPCAKARNLGVVVDKHLEMDSHISNILRIGWACIYKLGKIRRYLDQKSTETLIHAYITSRIDTCNSLLAGLPAKQIQRLQKLQNAAARLVTGTKRNQSITPVLYKLHWLPVSMRIQYKIALLTFKCLNDMAPSYLKQLVHRYEPTRSLRSESQNLLEKPSVIPRCVSYGERAFSEYAPSLWNSLPEDIRSQCNIEQFKTSLKTHFFQQHFGQSR